MTGPEENKEHEDHEPHEPHKDHEDHEEHEEHEERGRPDPPGEGGRSRWRGWADGRRERPARTREPRTEPQAQTRSEPRSETQAAQDALAEVREPHDTLAALRSRLDRALDDLTECRASLELREEQLALEKRESARTAEELDALRARLDTEVARAAEMRALRDAAERTPAVVPELIGTADQLTDLRTSVATGAMDAAALLRWLERRVPELLAQAELETVDDDGPLDLSRRADRLPVVARRLKALDPVRHRSAELRRRVDHLGGTGGAGGAGGGGTGAPGSSSGPRPV